MRDFIQRIVDVAAEMRSSAAKDRGITIADRMLPYIHFQKPAPDVNWDEPEVLNCGRSVRFSTLRAGVPGVLEFHTDAAGRAERISGDGVREVRFAREKLSPDDLLRTALRAVRTEHAHHLLDALEHIREENRMPDRVPFQALHGHAEASLTADGCVVTLPAVTGTLQVDGTFAFNAYGDATRMTVGKVIDAPLGGRSTREIAEDRKLVAFQGSGLETAALVP